MIYFDNAASSKPTRLALDSYAKLAELSFANAASPHKAGREANRYLEEARKRILKALRLEKTHSILFTSGATEANNLALKGVAFQYASRGKKIVSCIAEHSSVKNALKGDDSVSIRDGAITLSAGKDGVKADNAQDAGKGFVYVAGGTLDITAGDDALQAQQDITVSGGSILVDAAGKTVNSKGTQEISPSVITRK